MGKSKKSCPPDDYDSTWDSVWGVSETLGVHNQDVFQAAEELGIEEKDAGAGCAFYSQEDIQKIAEHLGVGERVVKTYKIKVRVSGWRTYCVQAVSQEEAEKFVKGGVYPPTGLSIPYSYSKMKEVGDLVPVSDKK